MPFGTARVVAACIALVGVAATLPAAAAAVVTPLVDGSASSAAALVQTLVGANAGVAVVPGSATYTGQASASGTFVNGGTGATGLGIDRGVVLTSGDARFVGSSAAFPGDSANKSGTFTAGDFDNALTANTAPGSALLSALTTAGTTNASLLGFRFVPTANNIALSFVFASEDYNDLVNTGFPTDVFGIFVNGVNVALVPGTQTPISAQTVNCGSGGLFGFASGVGAQDCAAYRDNPPFFGTIDTELDGLTTVFTLMIPVTFGQVTTITIGIADAFDDVGDSALLLAAGSLQAVPEPAVASLLFAGVGAIVASRRRRPAPVAAIA